MNLYTECFWDGWDKIVDIYTDKSDSIPDYINDENTYKIIILEKGVLSGECDGMHEEIKAPALIMLSQNAEFTSRVIKPITAGIIFFKPSVIRDEFLFDRIDSGEFESAEGQLLYQDYLLIKFFSGKDGHNANAIDISVTELKQIKNLFASMDRELKKQRDGFWPCRSRSFMIEILHCILYTNFAVSPDADGSYEDAGREEFLKIAEYLEQHLADSITLAKLTSRFAINRNKLNEIFVKQTSMTCLNYLLHLRIDLAKSMLSNTELPISEISGRVGYPDPNYFTKVFRESVGMTPSQFRRK